MTGSIWSWSKTAANNGSSDAGINYQEGQTPSSINDSARQGMGRVAEYLSDMGGATAAGGTGNALTFTASSAFTALADGITITFRAIADNTGPATINVNSLGAKAIRRMAGSGEVDLVAGDIKSGGPYRLYYGTSFNSAAGAWMLMDAVVDTPNLVTLTGSQTLTNKTLTSPVMAGNPTAPTAAPGDNDTSVATTAFVAAAISPLATTAALNTKLSVTSAPTNVSRKNLKIVTTSVTAGTITADQLILEDGSGTPYRAVSVSVSYATGSAGANGLDTGSIAASNWYYEWVIYNGTTVASLLSLSSTSPTMPSGYTFKARVGAVYFDAGSKLRFKVQYDRRSQIVIGTNPTTAVIAASGSSGSPTTPTWTAVAVGALVPATASAIRLSLSGFSANPNAYVIAAPNNSYGAATSTTNPPPLSAPVKNSGEAIGIYSTIQGEFVLESTNIYYASASTGSALVVTGWEDNL